METKRFFQPETLQELEEAVAKANEEGKKIRPVGSALSPNGLSFCEEGMISMALLDKVRRGTRSGKVGAGGWEGFPWGRGTGEAVRGRVC